MTAKELKRDLVAAGWLIKQGGRHELAVHPDKPGVQVPIHRHTGDICISDDKHTICLAFSITLQNLLHGRVGSTFMRRLSANNLQSVRTQR